MCLVEVHDTTQGCDNRSKVSFPEPGRQGMDNARKRLCAGDLSSIRQKWQVVKWTSGESDVLDRRWNEETVGKP